MAKKQGRGGARPGSGRKRKYAEDAVKVFGWLSPEEFEMFEAKAARMGISKLEAASRAVKQWAKR